MFLKQFAAARVEVHAHGKRGHGTRGYPSMTTFIPMSWARSRVLATWLP